MRRLYKMLLLICLICVNHPCAAITPVHFIGQYSFSWAGIHLGKLALAIDETEQEYHLHLGVVSGGIVNLFTRHENDTVADGKRTPERYRPHLFDSHYKTKKKPRHVRLVYDDTGKLTEETNEPPENRAIRPEVPAPLKDGSYDPLAAMMALRGGLLSIPAFDAKRFYEVKAEDKGVETLNILSKDMQVRHYILTRKPLAGMTAKETSEYAQGEPPLHFYLSDDARRVPVYMTMPILLGSVKGTLSKECGTWDECKVQ